MSITIWNIGVVVLATLSLTACNAAPEQEGNDDQVAGSEKETAEIAALSCDPLGDMAVSIETAEGGDKVLVMQMQSELAPDAQPTRLSLEPTGMSAGSEGTRMSDADGEYTVWIMDDGTATVNTGDFSVNCKA